MDEGADQETKKFFLIGFGDRAWAEQSDLVRGVHYEYDETLSTGLPNAQLVVELEGPENQSQ
eukprot:49569-Eustigmatos_ZCMA.PRE.1